MHQEIKAVAFDLDGTLYPNYRFNLKIIPFIFKHSRLLYKFGKTRSIIRKQQEDPSFIPKPDFYQYQAEILASLLNTQTDIIMEKTDRLIYKGWEPIFKKVKLYPYVEKTLNDMRKAGLKLGLLSDFPPKTKLIYLGLPGREAPGDAGIWDAVMCSEHSGTIKPHPKSFLELASELGQPPEKILYVGNSLNYDITGANRAGMKTAWIKHPLAIKKSKSPAPDFTFSDYRQLYDFVLN